MKKIKTNQDQTRTCPHCGSSRVERDNEKLVCKKCGTVIESLTISSENERYFSYEDALKKGRHSYTPQFKPNTKTERKNLMLAISHIEELRNKLHLPQFVKKDAIKNFKKLMQKKTVRKDTIPSTVAAFMYIVGRKSRIPISLKQVSEKSGIDRSDIMKQYQEIVEKLKIDVPQIPLEGLAIRFAKKANLSPKTRGRATHIAEKLKKSVFLMGKDPKGIAAAAVYIAAKQRGEEITQDEMAEIASITTITLRSQLKTLPSSPI